MYSDYRYVVYLVCMLSAHTFLYNLAFCCMYWRYLKPCYSMGLQR